MAEDAARPEAVTGGNIAVSPAFIVNIASRVAEGLDRLADAEEHRNVLLGEEIAARREDRSVFTNAATQFRRLTTDPSPEQLSRDVAAAGAAARARLAQRAAFLQSDRQYVIEAADGTYRKRSRIVAIRMIGPFTVQTDRGLMEGSAGDWLVTNHPDDDPGSDVWSISDERMRSTYEPIDDEVDL